MNSIYRAIGMSKQNFHKRMNVLISHEEEKAQLLKVVQQVREDHPCMSARKIYRLIQPRCMGRDKFEAFCFEEGYRVKKQKNYIKTTNSLGVTRFPNLIKGVELTGINQVWVSDITYIRIEDSFYYLTFIMDLYSRKILGYSASNNLLTVYTTLPALKMAIKSRGNNDLSGVIFHSDGGGQYYCKEFLRLTTNMKNSMGEDVYENAHAERLNGTIKNDYLIPYSPLNFLTLKRMLKKAVALYNNQRPHRALEGLSPVKYEKQIGLLTEYQNINKGKKEIVKDNSNNNNTNNSICLTHKTVNPI
jgi:transposase InsO family protein